MAGAGCGCATGTAAAPELPAVIGAAGALRTDTGAVPGACAPSRCPQCWQNANPTGVPLPHAGQIALAAAVAGAAAAAGAAGATLTGPESTATVDADASGAAPALAISEVPHILQKFMPGGFTVPQALQVIPPPLAAAGFGAGAGKAGSRRWPQS
jgi:hypothetical protein